MPVHSRNNVTWLCGFGALLSFAASLPVWIHTDQLRLATQVGWFLPVSIIGVFVGLRVAGWRELSQFATCLWFGTALYHVGDQRQWWTELGLSASTSVFVFMILAVVVVFELATSGLGQLVTRITRTASPQAAEEKVGEPQKDARVSWISAGPLFAAKSSVCSAWGIVCCALLGPVVVNLAASLGSSLQSTPNALVVQPLSSMTGAIVVASFAALTAISLWLAQRQRENLFLSATAVLPVGLALTTAAWVVPPYSLVAALGLLSIALIISDLVPLFISRWSSKSQAAWQQVFSPSEKFPSNNYWLLLGRVYALSLLVAGSALALLVAALGELPSALSPTTANWLSNVGILLISFGPLLGFLIVRWSLSIWQAEQPYLATTAATTLGVCVACTTTFALVRPVSIADHWIVLLQSFSLVVAALAWIAIGFHWLKNFLGLRSMLAGKVPMSQLLTKAMKGQRWQRAETSAWTLANVALVPVVLLCIAAAYIVVVFPIWQLPGIERMGALPLAITSLVTLALFSFLSVRRGISKFGLLATVLGLITPLGAAAYTSWLIAVPERASAAALGFEPIRALISLWLITLTIGLGVRIGAAQQGRVMRRFGETAWVLLAMVVAVLAIMSTTQDPNFRWPLFELTALALITVLSGVFSGQPWRGHLAAVAAAIGLSGWFIHHTLGGDRLYEMWIVLWGPVWVAIVATAAHWMLPRSQADSSEADSSQADSGDSVRIFPKSILPVDMSVSLLVPVCSALASGLWIATQNSTVAAPSRLTWWVLGLAMVTLGLAIGRLWNPQPSKRGLGVYASAIALGLVCAVSLCSLGTLPRLQTWLLWLASGLASMAIIAAVLRELVRESWLIGPRLRLVNVLTTENFRHALVWMPSVHMVASLLALAPSIILVMAFEERTLRIAATALPFIGALSILPIGMGRGQQYVRYCGLSLISISCIMLWWADLPSAWTVAGFEGTWIFVQRALVGCVLLGITYPALAHLLRHKAEWVAPLMHLGWLNFFVGAMAGVALLVGQATENWDAVASTSSLGTKLLTLAAWTGIFGRLILFAARPHSLDQTASVPLRKAAVFLAEGALAGWCAACYFHFPDLFSGILADWWPIVVFAIAILSAGVGEWLRRMGQSIVADPIHQSSLLLPAIPLAGVWWLQPDSAAWLWSDWGKYAVLLLTAAGLYGLHGWLRNSVTLRAMSGALALFSFWSVLQSQPDLRFLEHPQFWLLPPALAALVFVEFNRSRLESSVVVATRYVAVLVAYLSSTAEVYLRAFDGQLWQPLLLLILALAGVAAGIILRVRAFLYCGAVFTLVALLGMVWHAQQAIQQVWPWWAFGIATGICLIVCLGYFEKNRPRVIAYLEQFKRWEQ
ncbi:MAG: hypothetical protein R3C53_26390 [Pirellulaceae bacterium]